MRGGYARNLSPPEVRVDPEDRCAAVLAYGRKINIIPFRRDVSLATTAEVNAYAENLPGKLT